MKRSYFGTLYPPRPEKWGLDMANATLARIARDMTCRANRLRNELEVAKSRDESLRHAARYLARIYTAAKSTGQPPEPIVNVGLIYLGRLTSGQFLAEAVELHNNVVKHLRSTPKPGTTIHGIDERGDEYQAKA